MKIPNLEIELSVKALPLLKWICITSGKTILYTASWLQLVLAIVIVYYGAPIDILLFAIAVLISLHYCMKSIRAEHDKIEARVGAPK
jgi:hypothetical protein